MVGLEIIFPSFQVVPQCGHVTVIVHPCTFALPDIPHTNRKHWSVDAFPSVKCSASFAPEDAGDIFPAT